MIHAKAAPMTGRRVLPNRRPHELRDMTFRGRSYTVGVARFQDGVIAEIFTDAHRQSTDAADDARDIALCISIAA